MGMHRSIRNTRRLAEVIGVLARHGFRQILIETGISHLIDRSAGSVLRSREEEETHTDVPIEARVRMALEELGPSFIKFGQIISTRPDLIPPGLATELKKLQSDCPRVEFAKIRDRLQAELGDRLKTLFTEIEETPIAAASMAQVHRATLCDGTKVALKVLRPGIEAIIQSDMDIMMEFARLAERSFADQGYSPTEIVREFQQELEREIDLIHEGRSTDRMRRDFEEDSAVTFPRVYWEATTRRVLALEVVEGRLLSRVDPTELPAEERRALAAAGVQAVFRQCLEIGFFHADPHPGNLFLLGDGRICFIDCGMTGRVDRATREQLAMLVMRVVQGDVDGVIDVAIAITEADSSLRRNRTFRRDMSNLISRFEDVSFEKLDVPQLLEEFFELLRRHRVRCPGDLVFLIKALTTAQGVGQSLDPGFDFVTEVRPYLERLVSESYGVAAARRRLARGAVRYLELIEDLPHEVRDLLEQIRRRELSVRLQHVGVDRLNDNSLEHASRTIANGLIVAGLMVGSSILILTAETTDRPFELLRTTGVGGLLLAVGLMGTMAVRSLDLFGRYRRWRDRAPR